MKTFTQILKRFFDFTGYSNLFLAFTVFCSTLQGGFIFTNTLDPCFLFALVNFLASFFLYNTQRIFQSLRPTTDERLLWYRHNKKYIFTLAFLLVFIFSGILYSILTSYYHSILIYVIIGMISLAYFLPPFEFRKKPYLKSFYIALVWVVVCAVVPFMFDEVGYKGLSYLSKDQWLSIISQFCFITAICMPFDIRDVEKDKTETVRSFPVLLGIKKSKMFAVSLMLLYLILAFSTEVKNLAVIRGLMFVGGVLVIWFSEPARHRYYFIYLADGLIVLQTLLLFIFLK